MLRTDPVQAEMYNLELSAQVDARMKEQGVSYRELADATGIVRTTMWNRLHAGGFTAREQWLVATALDTSVAQLVADAVTAVNTAITEVSA